MLRDTLGMSLRLVPTVLWETRYAKVKGERSAEASTYSVALPLALPLPYP